AGGSARRQSRTIPAVFEPLSRADAVARIAAAEQRGDIADAVLGFCADNFEVATLLLVRDNMAFGWKGFGPELDPDRIETLLVPLDVPSMFQVATHSEGGFYRGRAFPITLHNHWFKVLRTAVPNYSFVTEIRIAHRIVNLLYGHAPNGND